MIPLLVTFSSTPKVTNFTTEQAISEANQLQFRAGSTFTNPGGICTGQKLL